MILPGSKEISLLLRCNGFILSGDLLYTGDVDDFFESFNRCKVFPRSVFSIKKVTKGKFWRWEIVLLNGCLIIITSSTGDSKPDGLVAYFLG